MSTPVVVDWTVPAHDLNSLYGDGATKAETMLPRIAAALAVVAVGVSAHLAGTGWAWWQHLIAAVLVFDLVGGVVAMALNSAKRFQHAAHLSVPRRAAAVVRNKTLFTALHIQPIVIGLLFDGPWWWGPGWYLASLVGLVAVTRIRLYLARPTAMLLVALTAVVAPMLEHPPGFAWAPVILITKLVLGAVREEPYRPRNC